MNIAANRLATILAANWWVLMARGLVAIAFGTFVSVLPGVSLAALVMLFGVYCFADGVLGIWTAITGRKEHQYWGVLLLGGLLGVGAGIFTFAAPDVTAVVLLFCIALWAIATGIVQIVAALRLRKEIEGEWFLILGGIASVVIGLCLLANPGGSAISLLWLIGIYAIVFGILLVLLSLKLRKVGTNLAAA
jgi:uncharacterized membrane protein HdeD (DUF308 family)